MNEQPQEGQEAGGGQHFRCDILFPVPRIPFTLFSTGDEAVLMPRRGAGLVLVVSHF